MKHIPFSLTACLVFMSLLGCSNNSITNINKDDFVNVSSKENKSSFQVSKVMSDLLKVKKSPEIIINDILIEDKSIMGELGTPKLSIKPKYSGNNIQIKIKGSFSYLKNIKMEDLAFTYEHPIINQSFAYNDNTPKFRVLIDDSILLNVQFISSSEIIANFDTRSIPDFYLKGLHKISVINNGIYTDTLISFNQAEEHADLKPKIDSAEIIKVSDKPAFIKLKGSNFMLYPKFSYCLIDNTFSFGYQTNIISGEDMDSWETLIHIPNIKEFMKKTNHTISYQTPFGISNINI
jgi:hypothetical protein